MENFNQTKKLTDVHNGFSDSRQYSENIDVPQSIISENITRTIFLLYCILNMTDFLPTFYQLLVMGFMRILDVDFVSFLNGILKKIHLCCNLF